MKQGLESNIPYQLLFGLLSPEMPSIANLLFFPSNSSTSATSLRPCTAPKEIRISELFMTLINTHTWPSNMTTQQNLILYVKLNSEVFHFFFNVLQIQTNLVVQSYVGLWIGISW